MQTFNERAFITKVEQSGPEELAKILVNPSVDEEKALRTHLGEERYQRMHSMASTGGSGDITWSTLFASCAGGLTACG